MRSVTLKRGLFRVARFALLLHCRPGHRTKPHERPLMASMTIGCTRGCMGTLPNKRMIPVVRCTHSYLLGTLRCDTPLPRDTFQQECVAGLAELLLGKMSQEAIASAPFPIKRNGFASRKSLCGLWPVCAFSAVSVLLSQGHSPADASEVSDHDAVHGPPPGGVSGPHPDRGGDPLRGRAAAAARYAGRHEPQGL